MFTTGALDHVKKTIEKKKKKTTTTKKKVAKKPAAVVRERTDQTIHSVTITGTQNGMTSEQQNVLFTLLDRSEKTRGEFHTVNELRHGVCVGADAQAHEIAQKLRITIHMHPPIDTSKMATIEVKRFDIVRKHPPDDYLKRNKRMVDATNMTIAFPKSKKQEARSGTWATIRYTKKVGKPLIIVFPDGEMERVNM